ncbi:uncharacterized protein [Onthophagus taurus]|uniref:uncharacterized protein n=1 Tax=Onthophagus taurus TaxID=166361 RepID=UPI000C209FF2|nr:uncharacterized protein LOC111429072 [Onthophagus taurus]
MKNFKRMATNSDGRELNENVPLKKTEKKTCFQYLIEGPRFITTAFGVFSIVITIALLIQIYYGDFQVVPHGSVATDSRECSLIGTQILKQRGNAVDSAIASAFCLAVVNPHTSGLDAGGQMIIYNHRTRENAKVIDFSTRFQDFPRLLVGMVKAHSYYGQLAWAKLIEPAADLAMKGSFVSKQLQQAIKNAKLQKLFPSIQAGSKHKQKDLANFLKTTMDLPDIYNQIKTFNQSLDESKRRSFKNYNVFVPDDVYGDDFVTWLNKVEDLNDSEEIVDFTYVLANLSIELFEHTKKERKLFGETTTNVAVMDQNDLYVSLVMGLSEPFGSKIFTETGYIPDLVDTSSFLPLILINRDFICAKRFVLGTRNLITALQIVSGLIIDGDNSTVVIEKPRFDILLNKFIGYEEYHSQTFNGDIIADLMKLGNPTYLQEPYSSCNIVEKISDDLNSHSDSRGGGFASRF